MVTNIRIKIMYVSIATLTHTQMSVPISASHLINLEQYSKPSPLPTINNEFDMDNMDRERLLILKDQDTLGKNVHNMTHKTIDLPNPHTHHTQNKKNIKKQHYSRRRRIR